MARNAAIVNGMMAVVWTFYENGATDVDILMLLNTLLR